MGTKRKEGPVESQSEHGQDPPMVEHGQVNPALNADLSTLPVKRKSGRPKGSKNKIRSRAIVGNRQRGNGNGEGPITRKPAAKKAFLLALARCGQVREACEVVNISSGTPYDWARRSEGFSEAMEAAREAGEKVLLDELRGIIKTRATKESNDGMTYFLTKRLDPRFRDNAPQVNVLAGGPTSVRIFLDDGTTQSSTAKGIEQGKDQVSST